MTIKSRFSMRRRQLLTGAGALAVASAIRAKESVVEGRYGDVIVLIPGIMGTVLTKDGRDLWAPSAKAIFDALASLAHNLSALSIDSDPIDVEDLKDGIRADRLVPDVHLIPGFWKISGYTGIIDSIQSVPGVIAGQNFFTFPYDWRRDCRVASRMLARKCDVWLSQWKRTSGNSRAKLVFVTHSMGGLVARHFIETMGGWQQTRKLVTVATPFWGSVKSLNYLSNGYPKALGTIDLPAITKLMRTFTSMYQLMPSYKCLEDDSGTLVHLADATSVPNIDSNKARAARLFHTEIDAAVENNIKLGSYSRDFRISPVVGTFQPTLQSCRLANSKLTCSTELSGFPSETGDGTVPRISAIPFELFGDNGVDTSRVVFVSGIHDSLQEQPQVAVSLKNALVLGNKNLLPLRGEGQRLRLTIEDAYKIDEPIHIAFAAELQNGGGKNLQLTIRTVDALQEVWSSTVVASDSPGQQPVELRIDQKGLYQATLTDSTAASVSTLFLVS